MNSPASQPIPPSFLPSDFDSLFTANSQVAKGIGAEEPIESESPVSLFREQTETTSVATQQDYQPETEELHLKVAPVSISDRTEEIEQLKSLLIQAQETIIKLLTDRVDDRSRIASLELELKLLPFNNIAQRNLFKPTQTEPEGLRDELLRVKLELEHLEKVHASLRLKHKKVPFWFKIWQSLIACQ